MPARDVYHDAVKNALRKDGWTITHDPYHLPWGGKDMYIDLGAEQFLAAEKTNELIAVETKSFIGQSLVESNLARVISFDPVQEVIVKWIP